MVNHEIGEESRSMERPESTRSATTRHGDALFGAPWEQRRRALRRLFEEIEPRYDRLNRRLSFGLDQHWRRWTARSLRGSPGPWVDLASGTGDLALALAAAAATEPKPPRLLRSDLSAALLRTGRTKLEERGSDGAPSVAGEMDRLPFRSASIGALAQGFALRHARDLGSFFDECARVVRPGGRIAILDMRYPTRGLGGFVYRPYFRWVLPRLAALFGADRSAYEFMVDSVRALPPEQVLIDRLGASGFVDVESTPGFLGAVRLLTARRS